MGIADLIIALAPLFARVVAHVVSVTRGMTEEEAAAYIKDFSDNPEKYTWKNFPHKGEDGQWH